MWFLIVTNSDVPYFGHSLHLMDDSQLRTAFSRLSTIRVFDKKHCDIFKKFIFYHTHTTSYPLKNVKFKKTRKSLAYQLAFSRTPLPGTEGPLEENSVLKCANEALIVRFRCY